MPAITCVEINPDYPRVGGKLLPEATWISADIFDITGLAESGEASDETIRDMAGHVSRQMLKHYSHIGMVAKRRAPSNRQGCWKIPPKKPPKWPVSPEEVGLKLPVSYRKNWLLR
jgi:hypothetical protein